MIDNMLNKIEIEGFKSIKQSTVELSNLNIMIGSNGAGKSNFLSMFTMFNQLIKGELQPYITQYGGANAFLCNGAKQTDKMKISFEFDRYGYVMEFKKTDNDNFYISNQNLEISKNKLVDSQLGFGYYDEIPQIIKQQSWRAYHFNDTSRESLIKTRQSVDDNLYLQYDGRNLASYLFCIKKEHKKNYDKIVETIKLIAPYFADFVLIPEGDNSNILLRWQQVGNDSVFGANQLSDGLLRFICMMTLLLQPISMQPDNIIIDEPELGLHPLAIIIFAEIAKKISTNKQIILATQSVELLNQFEPNDVIVVDRDTLGSRFRRLKKDELDQWFALDYSLGDLWNKNVFGGRL